MKRRDLSPLQCSRVNQCFLPCPDKEKIISKFEMKDLRKSYIIIPPFKQLIIHTQIATRHLNETPHGWYVIWIASCPSKKRTAISSPLFSTLFPQISITNLKKDECNAISMWFIREEVKGLFNFLLAGSPGRNRRSFGPITLVCGDYQANNWEDCALWFISDSVNCFKSVFVGPAPPKIVPL